MEEFFNKCATFDWFYSFSDDGRVYRSGHQQEQQLVKEAKTDPIKLKIWNDWGKHMFGGEGWSTPATPKPKLEDYA